VTGALNLPPCTPATAPVGQDFDTLKRQFFGSANERGNIKTVAAKAFAFHYAIGAPNLSGLGTTSGCAEIAGNDLAYALGSWVFANTAIRDAAWEGTIMHELGHNVGLRHGGGPGIDIDSNGRPTSANCKPNYLSVMSYSMQMPAPIPVDKWKLDYSRIQLPTLSEGSLNESTGVFGTTANQATLTGLFTAFGMPTKNGGTQAIVASASGPLNFNGDRTDPSFETVSDNANGLGAASGCDGIGSTLAGFNDWANLVYAFQSTVDFADGVHGSTSDSVEMTQEQHDVLVANTAPLITLTKTGTPASVGSTVTYTLAATNTGPKPATNMIVADTLPTGVTFVSATPPSCTHAAGVVTCNTGSLAIGSTFTATITATVKRGSGGQLTNQAAVSSDPDNTLFRANVTFTSPYAGAGFNPPIDNPPAINQVQAGSSIPVKFTLGGNFGPNVFATVPSSQQVNCTGLPGTVTLVPGTAAPATKLGAIDVDVSISPNQYHFDWQTSRAYAGTCRMLIVQLNDGTTRFAFFQFS
jgi:uncharacterized repeat protein (TIGR01451 family)